MDSEIIEERNTKSMGIKKVIPEGIYCVEEGKIFKSKKYLNSKIRIDYPCPFYKPNEFEFKENKLDYPGHTGVCRLAKANIRNHVKVCKLNYKLDNVEIIEDDYDNIRLKWHRWYKEQLSIDELKDKINNAKKADDLAYWKARLKNKLSR